MAPPPIHLFLTTIASQPALRQRQEYLLRVLQVKKIPFSSYDLASDEDAKKLWRRQAPADKQQLPGILIGGKFPGTFADFEDAVECDELDTFLRRNETYKESEFEKPAPEVKPIGVPGAYSPSQMHPKIKPSPSPSPSPSKAKSKGKPGPLQSILHDAGIYDIDATDEELAELVNELGLVTDDNLRRWKELNRELKDKEVDAKAETNTEAEGKPEKGVEESSSPEKGGETETTSVTPSAQSTKSD